MSAVDYAELRRKLMERLREETSVPAGDRPAADTASSDSAIQRSDGIAVVGVHCRFPGSEDADGYFDSLLSGKCHIGLHAESPREGIRLDNGKAPRIARLDDVFGFDHKRFNLSPREAEAMDPHHRLMLESASLCIEDAGYTQEALKGTGTAVFIAMYNQDFSHFSRRDGWEPESRIYLGLGSTHSMLSNRISFLFDFRGPSEIVDTACSSSIVAVHRAMQAIRSGECAQALVGGVSLLLEPDRAQALDRIGVLCRDEVARILDAKPNGQSLGEGVASVLLKPLNRAIVDRDHIYGVLRGSRVGHRGQRSGRLTLPDADSQEALIRDLHSHMGLDGSRVSYVEAHGSGGNGDVPELIALQRTHSPGTKIGSVKGNIGCLEAAGGLSQLVKLMMAFRRREMPGTVNHVSPPVHDQLASGHLDVLTANIPLERINRFPRLPMIAAINAYGLGGANAHLIVEEPPRSSQREVARAGAGLPALPILVSGDSGSHLKRHAESLLAFLRRRPETDLADVAFTLAIGRRHGSHRVGWIASRTSELIEGLELVLRDAHDMEILRASLPRNDALSTQPSASALDSAIHEWMKMKPVDWDVYVGAGRRTSIPPAPMARRSFPIPREAYGGLPPSTSPSSAPTMLFSDRETALRSWICRQLRLNDALLQRDTPLVDYGLDSIALVSLCTFIDRQYGVSCTPASLGERATIGHILDMFTDRTAFPHVPRSGAVTGPPHIGEDRAARQPIGQIVPVKLRREAFRREVTSFLTHLAPVQLSEHPSPMERFHVYQDRNANLWLFIKTAPGNTFDLAGMRELLQVLCAVRAHDSKANPRILYVSHLEDDFSLGGDRRFFAAEVKSGNAESIRAVGDLYKGILQVLATINCLTVGVAYGNALGGGLELLMAMDYQIVLRGAKLALPEVRSGLIAGMGGITYLTSLVGASLAMRLNVSGEAILSQEAAELGIISHLSDDPFDEAMQLGRSISDHAAAMTIRKLIHAGKYALLAHDVDEWVAFVSGGAFLRNEQRIDQDFEIIHTQSEFAMPTALDRQ